MPLRPIAATLMKRLLRRPADMLLRSASVFRSDVDQHLTTSNAVLANSYLTAKFVPAHRDASFLVPVSASIPAAGDGFPLPPIELMEGYQGPASDPGYYLRTGRANVEAMLSILQVAGIVLSGSSRILELGCSSGRLLRHFADLASQGAEVRGVDISAANIAWAQRYLSPPFLFTTTTTFPHLPFEDRSFDFIFAGSVFTHIRELGDTWLMELRRLLTPGGALFLTVIDEYCVNLLEARNPTYDIPKIVARFDQRAALRLGDFEMACVARSPKEATVFHSEKYIRGAWSREFELLSYTYEGHGYQSAILLRRPSMRNSRRL